ncbi:hypothetical protein [Mycobacterium hubeiense]|uniref:hypothetical protein n=1 Tax=Mycobacterium hubeiense TaxID=1867256 RepID=UPI000C7F619E|nr:hypothetical protein [Mycobacterium sp. QGD 101]
MNLIPTPKAKISDADIADVLGRAVQIIDPLLDILAETDPLGLKHRTRHLGDGDGAVDKIQDTLARVLNIADVPGTSAWDGMDLDARVNWWVRRVGALNNVAVAFPGFLGVIADRLPIQDLLGFANQAIVLCAVAREHGVTDRQAQVRLLASVLCHRELPPSTVPDDTDEELIQFSATPAGVVRALWSLAGLLNAIRDELARRPHPRAVFRVLGMLPAVGAVVDYFGEFGALQRAAEAGRQWIGQHSTQ